MTIKPTFYWLDDIDSCKRWIRNHPDEAQALLMAEYRRPEVLWTLVQWLKRHRPHNATTRVIKAKL